MLCWSAIAMAIGCACRRRGSAGAIAGLLALTAYLTDYIGRAWKPAESVAWLSPFRYYTPFELLMGSALAAKSLYVLGGIAAAAFALAYLLYCAETFRTDAGVESRSGEILGTLEMR